MALHPVQLYLTLGSVSSAVLVKHLLVQLLILIHGTVYHIGEVLSIIVGHSIVVR